MLSTIPSGRTVGAKRLPARHFNAWLARPRQSGRRIVTWRRALHLTQTSWDARGRRNAERALLRGGALFTHTSWDARVRRNSKGGLLQWNGISLPLLILHQLCISGLAGEVTRAVEVASKMLGAVGVGVDKQRYLAGAGLNQQVERWIRLGCRQTPAGGVYLDRPSGFSDGIERLR